MTLGERVKAIFSDFVASCDRLRNLNALSMYQQKIESLAVDEQTKRALQESLKRVGRERVKRWNERSTQR